MVERRAVPEWCIIIGPAVTVLSAILLYRLGHRPTWTWTGMLLGIPFGMATYASFWMLEMESKTYGQRVSRYGVFLLFVLSLTVYEVTTGSAGITMGLAMFVLGGIDNLQLQ